MRASHSQSFRLTMFGLIYFVQGSALAYFRNFQKPYLDGLNIDADVIGLLTSILLLPFILKIFIGMLSDRVSLFHLGHRKPYMILGLLLAAIAFGAAGFVLPDTRFTLFAVLIVCGSFSVALFDSTSDGLAIDITPQDQQGRVQGTMVGGRAMGLHHPLPGIWDHGAIPRLSRCVPDHRTDHVGPACLGTEGARTERTC